MKKSALFLTVVTGLLLAVPTSRLFAAGASTNEVTITGSMVCGKCTLHLTKTCQNVVQVTKDGKTVNYFLTHNDVSKGAHAAVCGGSSEKVTVTGIVKEKDGKEILTPTKIAPVK